MKYDKLLRRISSFSMALLLPKSLNEKALSHTTKKVEWAASGALCIRLARLDVFDVDAVSGGAV